MPFLLLLVLTVACLPGKWPAPPEWLGAGGSALAVGAGVLALAGLAGVIARRCRLRLLLSSGEIWPALLRRYRSGRFFQTCSLLGFYLAALFLLGWVDTARGVSLFGMDDPPGVELLILAPLVAGLLLSWAQYYEVERVARAGDAPPSRRAYVGAQAQSNLVLVCPPLLLIVAQGSIRRLFPDAAQDQVFPVLSMALILAVFLCIPWVLRLLLALKPLPPGTLRDRLGAAARRLDFRCNDILIWNTRHGIANAMVTGVLPWLRYVVVTDRLVSDLTPDEIEAVFGHEVGHVKHRHLPFYMVFLLLSLVALAGLWEVCLQYGLLSWMDAEEVVAFLPLLALLGAYIFLVFGFLSRRCERQADIYGCRAVSCPRPGCEGHGPDAALAPAGRALCPTGIDTFTSALRKVARSNGIHPEKPGWLSSWQHSTISRRVEFLQQMRRDPGLERHFQRRVGLVKWSLFLGLGVVFALLLWALGPQKVWNILGETDKKPAQTSQSTGPSNPASQAASRS